MNKIILGLIGIFLAFNASAQNVEMISSKPEQKLPKEKKNFEWISPQMDLGEINQIAVFRVAIERQGKNGMDMSFYTLRELAQKIGANTFKISKIEHDSSKLILVVNTYYLNRGQMERNLALYERDFIALIGCLNASLANSETYYLNNVAEEIAPFAYKKIANKDGDLLRISIKQDDKAPMSIFGKKNNLGTFITQGDSDLGTAVEMKIGQAAYSVNAKRQLKTNGMIYYKLGFARYAMDILDFIKEKQIVF